MTSRQWELSSGPAFVDSFRAEGVASRMLADVCEAVRKTVNLAVGAGFALPSDIVANYPRVLRRCDSLAFDHLPEALAYMILHLPDRFCRVVQALEILLLHGTLPLGRGDSGFSAVDIGAGPGPGIFAIRSFYAGLSNYARRASGTTIAPLTSAAVVERSEGMSWAMHHFAEHLILTESGRSGAQDTVHPLSAELAASAVPFGASHNDFQFLDLRNEHHAARNAIAVQLQDELGVSIERARSLAYEEPIQTPSAYGVVLMTNFLTQAAAVLKFEESLQRVMNGLLVPGGIFLVLGGVGAQYVEIYEQLDAKAARSRLRLVEGFEAPLQAGDRPGELHALCAFTRQVWAELGTRADNVSEVERQLSDIGAADIFDDSLAYRLPRFRVRAYRRVH